MNTLKKHFLSGLIFIIPISLSLWILFRIIVFLENILGSFMKNFLPDIYIPGLGFFSLIFLILLIGFIADNFFGKKLLSVLEKLFQKTPVINRIYMFIKNVSQSLLHGKSTPFRYPVKIEFFSGTYTIGFITGEFRTESGEAFLNVFVPTVPNISTGFYLMVPKNKAEKLNLSVEEALKTAISMGMFESEKNGSGKNRSDNPEKK
ncbi:MAG: DUF502 domain-containing protein [Candidatus Omnitrophica bacterium]|nr:DUF502 domain-containing protein [Candidatus Omnitrophota bacterium]